MGSPGTRRARRRLMLNAARAKKADASTEVVEAVAVAEPEVVEAPVVAEATETPEVEEGLLKKAIRRGRRKKSEKKSEE